MIVAAGVRIRRDDGQVLMVQHHVGVAAGRWSVPFDGVAEHETAEGAALRIVRDALHLEPGSFVFAETLSLPAADEDIVVNVFDVVGWGGEPRFNGRDFDDAGWLDPSLLAGVDVVPEVAAWLSGGATEGDVHESLERLLIAARGELLAAYERVPAASRERALDGEWAAVDVLHHCASREAYTVAEALRFAETPGHRWREFSTEQAEVERRLHRRPSDADVRERSVRAHDETLRIVQTLMPEQLLHYGVHPERGAVQVREQLEGIAAHDREHIEQLRAMQSTALLQA